jgi:hypothetical protein
VAVESIPAGGTKVVVGIPAGRAAVGSTPGADGTVGAGIADTVVPSVSVVDTVARGSSLTFLFIGIPSPTASRNSGNSFRNSENSYRFPIGIPIYRQEFLIIEKGR